MGHKVTVAYYSTTKGVTEQQTGEPTIYYGKVFKIPSKLFSEEGDVDFETEIAELVQEIQSKDSEPMLDAATVERYETLDIETGDAWVMYRVPCKAKDK